MCNTSEDSSITDRIPRSSKASDIDVKSKLRDKPRANGHKYVDQAIVQDKITSDSDISQKGSSNSRFSGANLFATSTNFQEGQQKESLMDDFDDQQIDSKDGVDTSDNLQFHVKGKTDLTEKSI